MGALLFITAIIVSFLTQIPSFVESGFSNILKLVWLLPLGYYVITSFKYLVSKSLTYFYCFAFLFFSYCLILQCIRETEYIGSDAINIAISLMVTAVSYCFWIKSGSKIMLSRISLICLICCCFLAVVVYLGFLINSSLSSLQYAFSSKNSMGQLLLNGAVLALTCYLPKWKIQKIFLIFCMIWILAVIVMLKSRATLVGVMFIILYYILQSDNKRIRKLVVGGTILFVILLIVSENIYDVIVNQIVFANRDASSLDTISSGRGNLISEQLQKIPGNLLLGSGNDYMDCFPLMMIVQYGLIGASFVFSFLYITAKNIYERLKPRKEIYLAVFLIFWAGMLNSLFEAQPPFGPGIKMFLLWMCLGFSLAKYDKSVKKANLKRNLIITN